MDHQAAAVGLLLDAPYQQSLARDSPGDEAEALGLACDLSVAGAAAAPPIRPAGKQWSLTRGVSPGSLRALY